MPRITRFALLPTWLQNKLRSDWASIGGETNRPPIRDAEYKVYSIEGSEWWIVDAGTGGVSVDSEHGSHAYVDLPDDSGLKRMVDFEGARCRDRARFEAMYEIVRGLGVGTYELVMAVESWKGRGLDDDGLFWGLVRATMDFKATGTWNWGSCECGGSLRSKADTGEVLSCKDCGAAMTVGDFLHRFTQPG